MKLLRHMRHKEYRQLFWKEFKKQLKTSRIGQIWYRLLIAAGFELLFAYLTLHLLLLEHKILIGLFGIGVCATIAFVIRSYYRTLAKPFRQADKVAADEIRRRLHQRRQR